MCGGGGGSMHVSVNWMHVYSVAIDYRNCLYLCCVGTLCQWRYWIVRIVWFSIPNSVVGRCLQNNIIIILYRLVHI